MSLEYVSFYLSVVEFPWALALVLLGMIDYTVELEQFVWSSEMERPKIL